MAHANAGRRAGDDDVARLQHHEMREIRDELADVEDHRLRIARLHALAIDVEPEVQALHIGDFLAGDEPRTERTESRGAFAFHPLAAALCLKLAFGNVVSEAITRDMIERDTLIGVGGALSDDDAELDLPIELLAAFRLDNRIVGAADA